MDGGIRYARLPMGRKPVGTDHHELIAQLRGILREARPYAIGAMTGGLAIGGTDLVNPSLIKNKEEFILGAFALTAKVVAALKEARRTARMEITAANLEVERVSRRMQKFIAAGGTFDQKTALLYNQELASQALEILRHDSDFKMRTIVKMEQADGEAHNLKKRIKAHPHDPQYREMMETVDEMLGRYEHTLHMLMVESHADIRGPMAG